MREREVITYYLLIYYLHVYFANIIFVNLFYYLVYANASSILLCQAASQDLDNLKFSINNGGKKKVFLIIFYYKFWDRRLLWLWKIILQDIYLIIYISRMWFLHVMRKMPLWVNLFFFFLVEGVVSLSFGLKLHLTSMRFFFFFCM